jgi:hypothetical protein
MKHFVRIGLACLAAALVVTGIAMGLDQLGIRGEGVHLGMILLGILLASLSDRKLFWPSASECGDGHRSGDARGREGHA